ncbi:MAG: patatin-like phospholipase family protein [Azospirillaceae bacterium]
MTGVHGMRLGLALGGGVARGWAHIGVLRALAEAGIEPDVIAGTSIGAVVGGCYLADELDALEAWARALTKMRVVTYLDFKVRAPGLLGGERLHRTLHAHLGDRTFEGLPKPFVAISADLLSGHEVWVSEGSLVDGLRASFAMPGVFPPVQIGDRLLVDGAIVNPVPVSVCRALGAQLVIAVNLNADIMGKARQPGANYPIAAGFDLLDIVADAEQERGRVGRGFSGVVRRVFRREAGSPSLFGVMMGSLGIVLDRVTRSRLAGDPPDVHITPRLGRIGLAEFHRAEEMIEIGRRATEDAMPDILDACQVLGVPVGPGAAAARAAANGGPATAPAEPPAAKSRWRPRRRGADRRA